MKLVRSVKELRNILSGENISPLGFVPTMGALHQGHLSLVRNAVQMCPMVVVSIYINPTQFNDRSDLENYPRTLDKDMDLLQGALREDDIVFAPGDKEIYPEKDTRSFRFGNLDKVMEAIHRPGHFNGVAQVVTRLFDIVQPDIAFFGQKDFQQLAVIKELVRQTGSSIRIIANPIIREADGLAMSSRNLLLEKDIRERAGIIYKTLSKASQMINERDIPYIKSYVKNAIEKDKDFIVEYFEIVDDIELVPLSSKSQMKPGSGYYGCIAVKAGKIRLIDNIEIPL